MARLSVEGRFDQFGSYRGEKADQNIRAGLGQWFQLQHLRAVTDPAARGERYLATLGERLRLAEIAKILKARMGRRRARVSTSA